jgi:hypothetical protein
VVVRSDSISTMYSVCHVESYFLRWFPFLSISIGIVVTNNVGPKVTLSQRRLRRIGSKIPDG